MEKNFISCSELLFSLVLSAAIWWDFTRVVLKVDGQTVPKSSPGLIPCYLVFISALLTWLMIQSFDCETVDHCWAHSISEMISKVQAEGRDQLTLELCRVHWSFRKYREKKFNLDKKEKTDDHKVPGVGQFGGSLENIGTNLTKLVSLGYLSTSANLNG